MLSGPGTHAAFHTIIFSRTRFEGIAGESIVAIISEQKQDQGSRLCVGAIDLQKDKMLKVPSSYYD